MNRICIYKQKSLLSWSKQSVCFFFFFFLLQVNKCWNRTLNKYSTTVHFTKQRWKRNSNSINRSLNQVQCIIIVQCIVLYIPYKMLLQYLKVYQCRNREVHSIMSSLRFRIVKSISNTCIVHLVWSTKLYI